MSAASPVVKEPAAAVAWNIHSVRGLACLLIVAFHVVGDDAGEGLRLADSSAWHYVMNSLVFLRLPLFTILSGYFYGRRRATRLGLIRFGSRKLLRIGLPLVCVTIVVWLLHKLVYGEPRSLLDAFLFGYGQLWYLEAVLILFGAVAVWDAFLQPGWMALALAGLAAIMVAQSFDHITMFLSFAGAVNLAPYFLFGIVLSSNAEWLRDPRIGRFALGIAAIVLIAQQFGLNGLAHEINRRQLPAALAGMAGAVYLLQSFPRNRLLHAIGDYSYTVFLWHVAVAAGIRLVLIRLGVTNAPVLFILIFLAAMVGPILLHRLICRIPLLCLALTGERGLPRSTGMAPTSVREVYVPAMTAPTMSHAGLVDEPGFASNPG